MSSVRWRRNWKFVVIYVTAVVALVGLFGAARVTQLTTKPVATAPQDDSKDVDGTVDLFDTSVLHSIDVRYDQADFDRMAAAFVADGTEEFIEADVAIDGTLVRSVGLRIKGGSSQPRARTPGALDTAALPWHIEFDEFVKNRRYQGLEVLAIRSFSDPAPNTGLNEALALQLVGDIGEPAERFTYASFSVNGRNPALRLAVEVPGDAMAEAVFDTDGVLYKSLPTGGFRYLGDDPAAYAGTFRQITAKKSSDLRPVIDLVRWVTEAPDTLFATELDRHVDTASLARYLAVHHLMANGDDMAGTGQNSYLWYDISAKRTTIVTWDTNAAFSGDANATPFESIEPPGQGHLLKTRFLSTPRFRELYLAEYRKLYDRLLAQGGAAQQLTALETLLATKGGARVAPAAVRRDADALRTFLATRARTLATAF